MRARILVGFLALLMLPGVAPPATAAPRDDADHHEFYFPSSDGINNLHADVLRPKDLPLDVETPVETPVILTVSPYTNHSGTTSPNDLNGEGPSPRFYDFLDLSGALDHGYTYVMVDLPGDGGSGGCNDWGGVREQTGVKDAVEWAAAQDWSNGKVALLGKSYDGWTGLMGIAQEPEGLAAVVSLEPVYSGYRYIWMNGVRRTNWPYGSSFTLIDAQPGRPSDPPEYHINGAPQAWCYPVNIGGQNLDDDEGGPYWEERNLLATSVGRTTPLFLTQGFLEANTKQDGTFEYFNSLGGNEHRAWYGQFDHCRAWETQGACTGGSNDRLAVGRDGFMDEMMRFLDYHLKGIEPEVTDPAIEVQDNFGRWRAEESWPPSDSLRYETDLRTGEYTDNGSGRGDRPTEGQGMWSVSEPLSHDAWFAGTPTVSGTVDAPPNANLAANVYDVDPDGRLTMISRGVQLLRGIGARDFGFELYGQDWLIEEGHRVGVLLSSANTDQFRHVATRGAVTIHEAKIELPFLSNDRTEFLEGGSTPRLESFLNSSTATLSAAFIEESETAFVLPPPLVDTEDVIETTLGLTVTRVKGNRVATATLTETESGAAIEGAEIFFLVNGEERGSVVTDESGRAQFTLRPNEFKGRDVIRAVFVGNDDYAASSAQRSAVP
jgi:predicted acyl esterase